VSLCSGPVPIPAARVPALLWGRHALPEEAVAATVLRHIRLPRLLLAMLVGAALAQSGAVMQGFFQNPMADPYIVGVSAGAALGASLAARWGLDLWVLGVNGMAACAFLGALLVTAAVYGLSVRGGRLPVTVVLLTGVALGSLASSLTSFLIISSQRDLHQILFWLMGGLAARRWDHVRMAWPPIVAAIVFVQFFARDLNIILQGEETAQHLGVSVEPVKRILLVLSALLAAAAVSVSGLIGFVGLIVPHVVRLLVGPDHRRLFPLSVLGGALLLVAADLVARTVMAPAELPVGIVTALLGGPFFLWLLSRRAEMLS